MAYDLTEYLHRQLVGKKLLSVLKSKLHWYKFEVWTKQNKVRILIEERYPLNNLPNRGMIEIFRDNTTGRDFIRIELGHIPEELETEIVQSVDVFEAVENIKILRDIRKNLRVKVNSSWGTVIPSYHWYPFKNSEDAKIYLRLAQKQTPINKARLYRLKVNRYPKLAVLACWETGETNGTRL